MAIQVYASHSHYDLAIYTQKYKKKNLKCPAKWTFQKIISIKKGLKFSGQLNGNLAMHKSFGLSHSNSNANGI